MAFAPKPHRLEPPMLEIMNRDCRAPVSLHRAKSAMPIAVLYALAVLGAVSIPIGQAQEPTATAPTPAERAKLLEEQTRPQTEVPFDPQDFDKFVGYYQRIPGIPVFFHIYRNADSYYSQITGQMPVQIFPESADEFFATVVAAQLSFDVGPDRQVTGLVLHQNGMLIPWKRVSTTAFKAASARLQQRIKDNVPSSGTEAALRHQIATLERGDPDYSSMGPGLAEATRQQLPQLKELFKEVGALKSLTFSKVLPDGTDMYLATFEHGQLECTISPLLDGKVTGDFYHLLP